MIEKKYEYTGETQEVSGVILHRIRAVRNFEGVKLGDIGGWIEKERNLSHNDNAWVGDDARVGGNARIYGDARVYGNAWVYGNTWVYGSARVYGNAWVGDDARVGGNTWVYGDARVGDDARVDGSARIYGSAWVYGDARVGGNAQIALNADIHTTSDYIVIGPIGSQDAFLIFYRSKNNRIYVKCGRENTEIDTWLDMIDNKYGNDKHRQAYRKAAEIARIQIELEDKSNE